MGKMDVHFSSESDEWETPTSQYEELHKEFNFLVDMAATYENTKCRLYFNDSLSIPWVDKLGSIRNRWYTENRYLWCNPPYSRGKLKKFLQRGYEAMQSGIKSVFLIPARTDTIAWHTYVWDKENHCPRKGVEVRFLKGRVKFEKDGKPILDKQGKPQSAPFPSAVVIFKGE